MEEYIVRELVYVRRLFLVGVKSVNENIKWIYVEEILREFVFINNVCNIFIYFVELNL